MKRALIIMKDLNNQQFPVIVERVKSLDDAKALADFLETNSSAQVLTYAFIEEEFYRGKEAQETGHYDRVGQQLKLIYLDADAGDVINFTIPAPNDNLVNAEQEATGDIIAASKDILLQITERGTLLAKGGGIMARF